VSGSVLKRGRKRNRPLPAKQKPRPPIQLNLESIREKQETDDILSKILKLYERIGSTMDAGMQIFHLALFMSSAQRIHKTLFLNLYGKELAVMV
jgi:hypothetical protein